MTQKLNPQVPHIESLRVKNYRALRDLEIKLTPLTVFLGPNGSGKSTIFDVFAFLSECFTQGLRPAWNKRNRLGELRSRGADGAIQIGITYRNISQDTLGYTLIIDEIGGNPVVTKELFQFLKEGKNATFSILDFENGHGKVLKTLNSIEGNGFYHEDTFYSQDVLAVNTFGQSTLYDPQISILRNLILNFYISDFTVGHVHLGTELDLQEQLSIVGDNLPNVIQYLKQKSPARLNDIMTRLVARVPQLESISTVQTADNRLLLQIKDKLFEKPIMAKYASDGTLKLLAYLTILYVSKASLIGIEEPENHLHPRLLEGLAEECLMASANTQLMITTHSPYFVNGLHPDELWVLYRDDDGYTQAVRASDMERIPDLIEAGAKLGDLWMEGYFEVGDPLTNSGKPKRKKG